MRASAITGFILGATMAGAAVLGTDRLPAAGEASADSPEATDAARSEAGIFEGYRRYHAVCSHCHGPDGLGSTFAPSLVAEPIAAKAFRAIVLAGSKSGASFMQGYADDPNVAPYIDAIRTYLDARQRGLVGRGRPPKP